MIVDFLLGVVHGLGSWLVGLLPSWAPMAEFVVENMPAQGGDFQQYNSGTLESMLITANYFLPLYEGFVMLGIYIGIVGLWAIIRFAMKLIPGVG